MKTISIALFALTALFMGSSNAFADTTQQAANWADKLNRLGKTESHLSIKVVDPHFVYQASKSLGKNVTVDTGRGSRETLRQKSSGGVIVGSGSDGTVPTSNSSSAGPIVIHPPITPETSITVVGRVGPKQSDTYCASKYKTDSSGAYVQGGGFVYFANSEGILCTQIGKPLRLVEGAYRLYLSNPSKSTAYNNISTSTLIVALKNQENLIIPLREIHIPKFNGQIQAELFRDPAVESEFYKIRVDSFTRMYKSGYDNFDKNCTVQESNIELNHIECLGIHRSELINFFQSVGFTTYHPLTVAKDGEYMAVFPGGYQIRWTIDGQYELTKGILVE